MILRQLCGYFEDVVIYVQGAVVYYYRGVQFGCYTLYVSCQRKFNYLIQTLANGSATNGTSNGTNNTAKQNGTLSNGIANGHHINEEDHQIEEVNGKADIKIQGNLLKIERTGPVEWSDDEYEDDEEEVEENNDIPPPPPPPPPPTNIPPPPPPPPPTQNSSK